MNNRTLLWGKPNNLKSRSYVCGFCTNPLASEKGYFATYSGESTSRAWIYICHHCSKPSFFDANGIQTPGINFGQDVEDITDTSVSDMYEEARRAYSAAAYTAAVLCCRKLLMHIAVSKGAKAGGTFASYVEFLASQNYVPPDARPWIDHIRTKGNESNHEISMALKEDAEELISFSEMLLKVIFEFPAAVMKRIGK
jgi:Domain of unknown function (DUF4145)